MPVLPGCVAVGDTVDCNAAIQEAIQAHVQVMREEGFPVPEPPFMATQVEVELSA